MHQVIRIVIHKTMNENELKNISENRLKEFGVIVPTSLPEIEPDEDLNPKKKKMGTGTHFFLNMFH